PVRGNSEFNARTDGPTHAPITNRYRPDNHHSTGCSHGRDGIIHIHPGGPALGVDQYVIHRITEPSSGRRKPVAVVSRTARDARNKGGTKDGIVRVAPRPVKLYTQDPCPQLPIYSRLRTGNEATRLGCD